MWTAFLFSDEALGDNVSAGRKGGDAAIACYHLFHLDGSNTGVFHLSGEGWAAKGAPWTVTEKGCLWVVGHRAICRRCVVETYTRNLHNLPNHCRPHTFNLKICYLEVSSNLRKVAPKKGQHSHVPSSRCDNTHIARESCLLFRCVFPA